VPPLAREFVWQVKGVYFFRTPYFSNYHKLVSTSGKSDYAF